MSLETPITLVIFNRPSTTAQVFRAIAQARPQRLYIAADGPRPDRPDDAAKVAATRAVVERVDWPCDVQRFYSDINRGSAASVAQAIDWAFQACDEMIVLEDDCVAHKTFFTYCEELLARFRRDQRVLAINGTCRYPQTSPDDPSYVFGKFFNPWGWATWRRAWEGVDLQLSQWPQIRQTNLLHSIADSPEEAAYYAQVFENCFRGVIQSWDYPWQLHAWCRHGLTISPRVNLISNIGFGQDASHTVTGNDARAGRATQSLKRLIHPPYVARDKAADRASFLFDLELDRAACLTSALVGGDAASDEIYRLEEKAIELAAQLVEKECVIQQQHAALHALHAEFSQQLQRRWPTWRGAVRRVQRMWSRATNRQGSQSSLPARLTPLRHADRIILGACDTHYAGWHATDRGDVDVACRAHFARLWPPGTRQMFLAEHVWEHLPAAAAIEGMRNCFEFLAPGGRLRLAVPDGLHPDERYLDHVRPGGCGPGCDDHQVLYNYRSLSAALQSVGFEVELLEYWNDQGEFVAHDWSAADGPIRRSSRATRSDLPFRYTSLIVDGRKPARRSLAA